MEDANDIRWMTVEEASTYLRVTTATLYNYMKDGRLPFYYLAGTRHRRVKKSDVEALLILGKADDIGPRADVDEQSDVSP